MGTGSKIVMGGDITQKDIIDDKNRVFSLINRLTKCTGTTIHEFTRQDIVRHPILIQLTDLYEEWKVENKIS
jgi:phosphate starvation-inducible protein PhoH